MNAMDKLSVVIAVLTYQRPEGLLATVPRLLEQAASSKVPATVLVIDNDPIGSARQTVEVFRSARLRYVNETRPGISAARNRALAEASEFDLLVFIDDDEVPVENWLNLLLGHYLATGADAVAGAVVSKYAHEPSEWIKAGEFFKRSPPEHGTRLTVAATNNLLLDLRKIRACGLDFDERFGLSGGSDTLFTRQLVARGGDLAWCEDAIVIDMVPAGRLTRSWVLRRALRSGNSWARVELELAVGPVQRIAARLRLTGQGAVRFVGGLGRYVLGLATRSIEHRAKGLRTAARGLGMLSGAFGYVYSEYRRSPRP